MRESMYADKYLRGNKRRGKGKGITIGTYLAYTLSGKAKSYASSYNDALTNAMKRRVAKGEAVKGKSAGGATAYYPVE